MNITAVLLALRSAASIGASWAVLALGAYISYRILEFADLSADGTFALGGVISAALITKGYNPFLTLLFAAGGGMLGGLFTSFIHTKLKIPGLLSGILTMLLLYPVNLRIMGGSSNMPLLRANTVITIIMASFGLGQDVARLIVGLVVSLVLIGAMYWFFGTEMGCALRATGDNHHMAKALGVNTNSMIMVGLVLSNGLIALSGALVAQGNGYADVSMGSGGMVIGLISIIIGSAAFRFLRFNFAGKLFSAVLGAILYQIILAVVLQLGILKTQDMNILTVFMMVAVISFPHTRGFFAKLLQKAGGKTVKQGLAPKAPTATEKEEK